ncbi:MAG: ferrous iron transport protein B [Candidatus Fimenecus sp.]
MKANDLSCMDSKIIALAGNPNVGKSTVFNALTGMHQHTGNWAGKTVGNAFGSYRFEDKLYTLVDLPGTYSLFAHSKEEECAGEYISANKSNAVAVVCDATCLARSLHLVLQIAERTPNVLVCVNLMDEAKRHGLEIDLEELSLRLSLPVVGLSARAGKGLSEFRTAAAEICKTPRETPYQTEYPAPIEAAILRLESVLAGFAGALPMSLHALSVQLLQDEAGTVRLCRTQFETNLYENPQTKAAVTRIFAELQENGFDKTHLEDAIAGSIDRAAKEIADGVVTESRKKRKRVQDALDKLFLDRKTGIPIMLLLLLLVFWITIVGANYPSEVLSALLFRLQDYLLLFCDKIGVSPWLRDMLVLGMYRVLAWVVAVMLPPMAIFFPLFTLLEDFGYLPRVAFHLDHQFRKANTCGKQALTMCMGFGCNAVGVTGCRIIDSPRERLVAMLTNSLVPCNGRFPTLISIITMFFLGAASGFTASALSSVLLTVTILFSVFCTFTVSKILTKTVLRGVPSAFTLELPPYRRPQVFKVIVRSVLDRTLFVLGRAVSVAAPAGVIIWLFANLHIGENTLLQICADFLDPFARLLGFDGVVLLAFILGFPANEIVFPIIIMAYMSSGSILEFDTLAELRTLLVSNGWTTATAISVMLFALLHWPCATTLLTIKKETKSVKWTLVSLLLPTAIGICTCMLFNGLVKLIAFLM